jgi:tRNA threonylcarbamoyladenosine biosynthesis protein TsaE
MSTMQTWETTTDSYDATEQVAARLGKNLQGGEVVELVSDLGGGKTTFTRGMVRGTGSAEHVGSPSFTISKEYKAPKFTVAHFDFYRLNEAGVVGAELAEVIGDPAYVTVVEWGDIVHDVLPEQRLTVNLTRTGEESRKITLSYPAELRYVVEGME